MQLAWTSIVNLFWLDMIFEARDKSLPQIFLDGSDLEPNPFRMMMYDLEQSLPVYGGYMNFDKIKESTVYK